MFNSRLKKQKGQSLLYVAVLIVILISGVFFVYDIGNIVNTKIKFQNGADAAALAAVAVKISKHHTDTLVRTSMFHEALAAQAQQRGAQVLLIKILLDIEDSKNAIGISPIVDPVIPGPGVPAPQPQPINPLVPPTQQQKDDAKRYKSLVNLTYRHVIKMHRERLALEAYYKWIAEPRATVGNSISGIGAEAVTEAARIGLRSNIAGLTSLKNPILAQNLKILDEPGDLRENEKFSLMISNVTYANESARVNGVFGKSYVEFDGRGITTTQGTALLKYFKEGYALTTNASAKIVSSDDLHKNDNTWIRIPGSIEFPPSFKDPKKHVFLPFRMLWYSPGLMSIELQKGKTLH